MIVITITILVNIEKVKGGKREKGKLYKCRYDVQHFKALKPSGT